MDPITKRLLKIEQLIASSQFIDAANELQATQTASPGDPRVYLLLSKLAEVHHNAAAAIHSMRQAVTLRPEWTTGVIEMALLLSRHNQFKEAIDYATIAVAQAPEQLDVLTRAVDVAHRAQHLAMAVTWLNQAIQLAPDHRLLKHLLADDLRALGRYAEAIAAYTALVESDPNDARALLSRIRASLLGGTKKLAKQDAAALMKLAPDDETYKFWSDIAKGKTPHTQPADVVRSVHDDFAELYDQHMVRGLGYQLPKQVAALITERYPDYSLNVLDLGCGTGLLGVCLGRLNGALVGVDVSEKMIAQAIRHGVYDRFHAVNVLDALENTPADLYQVVAACDVFSYVGDLTSVIPNAFRILVSGGSLIFSCETADEGEANLVLRSTVRYAHKPSQVQALCNEAGFDQVSIQPTVLFNENQVPVKGFVVVARKPV